VKGEIVPTLLFVCAVSNLAPPRRPLLEFLALTCVISFGGLLLWWHACTAIGPMVSLHALPCFITADLRAPAPHKKEETKELPGI